MLVATDYEILRDVVCSTFIKIALPRRPRCVATLLNEEKLKQSGGALIHLSTVFLDERMHDWDWKNGLFRYYSHAARVGEKAGVVIVYEFVNSNDKGKSL